MCTCEHTPSFHRGTVLTIAASFLSVSAMKRRRPTLHLFADRILDQKKRLEAQVAKLQPGPEREQLLMKLRELNAASDIDEWLSPPGSQAK
jgi:hypothetical protein